MVSQQLHDSVLMTRAEVAELLGVSEKSVERYYGLGQIPKPLHIGPKGCRRWLRSTLMAFLEKQQAAAQRA